MFIPDIDQKTLEEKLQARSDQWYSFGLWEEADLEVTVEAAGADGEIVRVPVMKGEDITLFVPRNGGFGASSPPPVWELDLAISKGWVPNIVPSQLAPVMGKDDSRKRFNDGCSIADHIEEALAELPGWDHECRSHLGEFALDCCMEEIVAYWAPGSRELGYYAYTRLQWEQFLRDAKAAEDADHRASA